MPEQRPDHPSDNDKIDIFVSKIYPYLDDNGNPNADHPNVRVLFGSCDFDGTPMPLMQLRDADTGELLTEYDADYVSIEDVFDGELDDDGNPMPPYHVGEIWHGPDGLMICTVDREDGAYQDGD